MDERNERWLSSMVDPFREGLLGADDLPERVRRCAEPLRDEPAFDPERIDRAAADVVLPDDATFEHPMLERVVRVGLAHIETTFVDSHPKYGVGGYAEPMHDAFPPTIIAAVDALTLWGHTAQAETLFGYWLDNFIRLDGTIDYYGPSLSEYGQLLTTARRLAERGGSRDWLGRHRSALGRLAGHLHELVHAAGNVRLLAGVPEADERDRPATYFHNNAWVVRGLTDWAELEEGDRAGPPRQDARRLRELLLEAIDDVWPRDEDDWWLRPTVEEAPRPESITATRLGSYTNYRYWPELLSSRVLPAAWMRRIVHARLTAGGQFCGTTRFRDHLDDWPLADHLDGLWELGRVGDFRLCLWGHIWYHQAEGHLTAYEQVSLPPPRHGSGQAGRRVADYCLPCQLVAVRAAARLSGRT